MGIEKQTTRWLGILILVLSLVYIFTTLGKTSWVTWIAITFGYFLTGFLILEGGLVSYWTKKEYKNIGVGDFLVWLTMITAGLLFINTTLLIGKVRDVASEWLISLSTTTGVIVGVAAGVFGIIYLFKAGSFK